MATIKPDLTVDGYLWRHHKALKPHPKNPNKGNDSLVQALIARFGFVDAVVIDQDSGLVVAGHTRARAVAALEKAKTPVPGQPKPGYVRVLLQAFSSPSERDAFMLAHNRSRDVASWDEDQLADVLQGLPDVDRLSLGWSDAELTDLLGGVPIEPLPDRPVLIGDDKVQEGSTRAGSPMFQMDRDTKNKVFRCGDIQCTIPTALYEQVKEFVDLYQSSQDGIKALLEKGLSA